MLLFGNVSLTCLHLSARRFISADGALESNPSILRWGSKSFLFGYSITFFDVILSCWWHSAQFVPAINVSKFPWRWWCQMLAALDMSKILFKVSFTPFFIGSMFVMQNKEITVDHWVQNRAYVRLTLSRIILVLFTFAFVIDISVDL